VPGEVGRRITAAPGRFRQRALPPGACNLSVEVNAAPNDGRQISMLRITVRFPVAAKPNSGFVNVPMYV
jgi:hypothetical protein